MNIRLFWNNLPRIVLRPFYFSFFFFQFFFLFKVLFVFFIFFFLVTITAPRWTVERREEKEIATEMIQCLFFSFFRLLMAFDFLPCNFTLEAVSFGSDVNTTLRAFIDCNRNFFFSHVESCFTAMFTMWWIIEDNWKKLIGNVRFFDLSEISWNTFIHTK